MYTNFSKNPYFNLKHTLTLTRARACGTRGGECNGERRVATVGRRLDIVDTSFVLTSIPLPSNIDATTAYNSA